MRHSVDIEYVYSVGDPIDIEYTLCGASCKNRIYIYFGGYPVDAEYIYSEPNYS